MYYWLSTGSFVFPAWIIKSHLDATHRENLRLIEAPRTVTAADHGIALSTDTPRLRQAKIPRIRPFEAGKRAATRAVVEVKARRASAAAGKFKGRGTDVESHAPPPIVITANGGDREVRIRWDNERETLPGKATESEDPVKEAAPPESDLVAHGDTDDDDVTSADERITCVRRRTDAFICHRTQQRVYCSTTASDFCIISEAANYKENSRYACTFVKMLDVSSEDSDVFETMCGRKAVYYTDEFYGL